MSMRFRGSDDVDAEQHVTCAMSDNYVMYHVTKLTETTWIIDDFQRVSTDQLHCYSYWDF